MASKSSYTTADGDKRYLIRWIDPTTGKHRGKSFNRAKDAEVFRLDIARKAQLGHLWQDSPQTFGVFAGLGLEADRVNATGTGWFERYRPTVRLTSFQSRAAFVGHLRPLLDTRLDRLTTSQVEGVMLSMLSCPRSAQSVLQTIKMVLKDAKRRGQQFDERLLGMPTPRYTPSEMRFLTRAEVAALAEASSEPTLITFTAYMGLRRGEVTALTPRDIDGTNVHVRRSLADGTPGLVKTNASFRVVPMPQQAREALEERLSTSEPAQDGYIFTTPRGLPWNGSYLSGKVQGWTKAAGLPGVTLHSLRHSYASWLIRAGQHPKVIQELMGHGSITVTMDAYGHLFEGQKAQAVLALEQDLQ